MPELIPAEPGTPEWHAARRQGVTATDIVAICGLSTWASAYSLYWQKLGQAPETPDNDRFRLGRYLQDYVEDRWDESNRLDESTGGTHTISDGKLFRSEARPWQMATLDSVVDIGEPLEVKTWADADRPSWDTAPPPAVRAQVLWQMDVMDVGVGHVGVVFLPSGEFRSYTIKHKHGWRDETTGLMSGPTVCDLDDDLELMRERGAEFYARLQGELPPPPVDASAATTAALKAIHADAAKGKRVPVDVDLWLAYEDAKHMLKLHEESARDLENQIREAIGVATEIEVDGLLVARRRVYDSPVKAHTRHVDGLWRVKNGDDHE
jgi:putative phage-type endonuclease